MNIILSLSIRKYHSCSRGRDLLTDHALALLLKQSPSSGAASSAFLLEPRDARNLSASIDISSSPNASVAESGLEKSMNTGLGLKMTLQ